MQSVSSKIWTRVAVSITLRAPPVILLYSQIKEPFLSLFNIRLKPYPVRAEGLGKYDNRMTVKSWSEYCIVCYS